MAENTTTKFTYQGWDSAKQTAIEINNGQRAGSTWLTYDANGFLTYSSVRDSDATRTLVYTSNAQGLVLSRFETKTGKTFKNFWYYAGGHVVGNISTDPDASRRNSFVELLHEQAKSGKNRIDKWKDLKPVTSSDFDQNYQAITTTYPANVGGTYIVNGGDTLQSVAAALWGDASMWYLLAEANGMVASTTLVSGQILVVPNKVTNIHNNANTFKPYNPGEVIGNIDPSVPAPPPPAKGGCGTLGMIIMVVVAIVVTIYTAGAAASAMAGWLGGASAGVTVGVGSTVVVAGSTLATVAASAAVGAVAAAAGSIASQLVGKLTGNVEQFSWKQVGQAALGGAVTAGIGAGITSSAQSATGLLNNTPIGKVLTATEGWAKVGAAAIKGAAGAAVTMALKGDWSWRQVAASSVGAAAGSALQMSDTYRSAIGGLGAIGQYVDSGISGAASGWASSQALGLNKEQTRAVMTQSFVQSLGNAIGSSVADSMSRGVDWSQAPDQSDAETARLTRQNSELRDAEYLQQSDAILNRKAADAWTATREQQWIDQDDAILRRKAFDRLEGINGMDAQSDAWVAANGPGKVGQRTFYGGLTARDRASVKQSDLIIARRGLETAPVPFGGRSTITDPSAYLDPKVRMGQLIGMSNDSDSSGRSAAEWKAAAAEYKRLTTTPGQQWATDSIYNGLWAKGAQASVLPGAGGLGADDFNQFGRIGIESNSHAELGVGAGAALGGALSRGAARTDFGALLRTLKGSPPEGMVDPHAHHILFKEGNGATQKALVSEGQAILRSYDIDPIMGAENLVWAPNRVTGQHHVDTLRDVVGSLKNAHEFYGTREAIVTTLEELGRKAAQRK